MSERRRWPRRPVAWFVRLVIDEHRAITATTTDASLRGLRLAIDDIGASGGIRPGAECRLEVHLPNSEARFVRLGEIRHVGEHGVGLLLAEPLPVVLVPPADAAPRLDSVVAAKPSRPADFTSVLSMLRSVTSISR